MVLSTAACDDALDGAEGKEAAPVFVAAYDEWVRVGGPESAPAGVEAVRIGEGESEAWLVRGKGFEETVEEGLTIRVPFPARGAITAITQSGEQVLGRFEPRWTPGAALKLEGREILVSAAGAEGRVVVVLTGGSPAGCAIATLSEDGASVADFPCPAGGIAGAAIVATPGGGAEAFVTSSGGAPELFRVRREPGAPAAAISSVGVLMEPERAALLAAGRDAKGVFAYAYGRLRSTVGSIGASGGGVLGGADIDTDGVPALGPGFVRVRGEAVGVTIDKGPISFGFREGVGEAWLAASPDGGALLVTLEHHVGWFGGHRSLEAYRLGPDATSFGDAETATATFDGRLDAFSAHAAEDGHFAIRACHRERNVFDSGSRCETFVRRVGGAWGRGPTLPYGSEIAIHDGAVAWTEELQGGVVGIAASPDAEPEVVAAPRATIAGLLALPDGSLRPLVLQPHRDRLYAPRRYAGD